MTDEADIRKQTLGSVIQHLEAMVLKQRGMARKEDEKGRAVKASQHSFAANVLREEIEWLKAMRRKACD